MDVSKRSENLKLDPYMASSSFCPFLWPSNVLHLFSIHVLKLQAQKFALCVIFMILVSLENIKKCVLVIAQLPQRLKSMFLGNIRTGQLQRILAFEANSAFSRENETKIVKITHSEFGVKSKPGAAAFLQNGAIRSFNLK